MIELTNEQMQFIESEVAGGGFPDANSVVQAAVDFYRRSKALTPEQDYEETVRELHEAVADMEAGRGRPFEEVDAEIRAKFGFKAR